MNADAFFTIGKAHHVCQDYAAVIDPGYVLLSDGCSSSPHTDVGARLLCRTASAVRAGSELAPFLAFPLLSTLGLPAEALDATLLSAEVRGEDVFVQVTGDGVVAARRRDGSLVVVQSEFPSGAPRYASYDLRPMRRTKYLAEFGSTWFLTRWDRGHVSVDELELRDDRIEPLELRFPVTEFDLVLLMSDGVLTFQQPADIPGTTKSVPLHEVLDEVLAFKGFAGQFVAKRMLRFIKVASAKGWHHNDDVSVAGIYLG